MTSKAIFRFSEVEAKKANPKTLRGFIKDVLKADDDACWCDMEGFLRPPGESGSREYDHAYAVQVLLKHDALHGGTIGTVMEATGMKQRLLWDELVKVIREAGFRFRHGRLVGVLEDMREDNANDTNGADADSIE